MKTFKTLTTLLMVIISLGITSCGNDDNEDGSSSSASIIGTWQSKDGNNFIITLRINNNGSFTMTEKENYQGEWESYTSRGEYKYEDDILTFYEDGDVYSYTIISITSKIMKLEDDEGDTITFNKI